MRQFQIIPIRISLKGNKYAKSRDIVSESQLTSPAVDLIAAGFIKEVFDTDDIVTVGSEEVSPKKIAEFPKEVKKVVVKTDIKDIKKITR